MKAKGGSMAYQNLTETNIKLCLEIIKELIESIPEETFRADAGLARKKEMADAAFVPLRDFINKLAKIQDEGIDGRPCIDTFEDLTAASCGRQAKINV